MEENIGGVVENVGEVLRVSVWGYILRRKVEKGFGNLWKVRNLLGERVKLSLVWILEGFWKESGMSPKMEEKVVPSNPKLMMAFDGIDGTSKDMANVNIRDIR